MVAQYQGIANFKVTRHIVWIQAREDPKNQWLQLRYCFKEEDVEMAIKDWHEDWRIPYLNQDIPVDKEAKAG
jgi:hypothetical protein